jgi:hypothetical protein
MVEDLPDKGEGLELVAVLLLLFCKGRAGACFFDLGSSMPSQELQTHLHSPWPQR